MDRVSKAERELVRKMQKKTNADRIRAMTDEELAEYLCRVENADSYAFDWLYWLKQEVDDV